MHRRLSSTVWICLHNETWVDNCWSMDTWDSPIGCNVWRNLLEHTQVSEMCYKVSFFTLHNCCDACYRHPSKSPNCNIKCIRFIQAFLLEKAVGNCLITMKMLGASVNSIKKEPYMLCCLVSLVWWAILSTTYYLRIVLYCLMYPLIHEWN